MRRPRYLAPVRIGNYEVTDEERAHLWDALTFSQNRSTHRLAHGVLDDEGRNHEHARQCSLGTLLAALTGGSIPRRNRAGSEKRRARRARLEREGAPTADRAPAPALPVIAGKDDWEVWLDAQQPPARPAEEH